VRFIQFLQFMMACAVALAGLGAQARVAENVSLEKFELMNIECARVWMAQAVDLHQENAFIYGESVSETTHYNYFRSYDAKTGRYTQSDPIGLQGGWNRFGYANGDGINNADPFGLCVGPLIVFCANPTTVAALGGLTSLGYATVNGMAGPASRAAATLSSSALVCRGGTCQAANFAVGTGVNQSSTGALSGVSVQCRPGAALNELAQPFRHNQVGVTTVGDIQRAGGQIVLDGTTRNPNHATINGLTSLQLERLFTPTVLNPVPAAQRGR
jgi:RHS repeat-associated protein